ncbi:MAG: MtrB/PioB family outer membrane beta-barrel protein [Thermoanaerobaculia bacterium]
MGNLRKLPIGVVVGCAALLAIAAPVRGEGSSQGFTLQLEPLKVSLLDVDLDTTSSKFNEYRDIQSGATVDKLVITGASADGNRALDVRMSHVGRRDARYTLTYGVAGRYEFLLDYNKIPHNFGNDGRILFTRTGAGRYEVADPIQASLQAAIERQFATNKAGIVFSFLNGLLAPYLATAHSIDLSLERDRTHARLDLGRMNRLAWTADYTHEARSGNRAYGASFGFSNVIELPEPIDYDTSGAELSGEWKGERGGVQFGYRWSDFKNHVDTLVWDNPFRVTSATDPSAYTAPGAGSIGGSVLGQGTLAPDNKAGTLYLNGRGKFGGWVASGVFAYTAMKQNDPLAAYTLNGAIRGIDEAGHTFDATDRANLTAQNADSKVNVTSFTGSLSTRLAEKFSLVFRGKYYDYDNKSRRIEFPGYVRYDAVWEAIGRVSVPYGYKNTDLSAEFGWDLNADHHLGASFLRRSWDRTFREVDSTDENIFKVSYDGRFSKTFDLRASWETADRKISAYHPEAAEASFVEPEGVNNQPDLRKYDEAARKYDSWKVAAHWAITDSMDLALSAVGRNDKYDKSVFGLTSDKLMTYNAEWDWAMGEGSNFFVFGTYADRKVKQAARQSGAVLSTNPQDNWFADFDEKNDAWGLGYHRESAKRWMFDLSATWSKSNGAAGLFSPPGGTPNTAVGFDNYEDIKLFTGAAKVGYQATDRLWVGVEYRYEDYTLSSFISQGLKNYLPGALILDTNFGDYTANVIGVYFKLHL